MRAMTVARPQRLASPPRPSSVKRIPGLALWLSSGAITGLVDGDPVASWTDLSGNGLHATQGTGSKRPTYKTGILNGRPAVQFATDDGLAVTDSAVYKATAITLVVVCSSTVSGATIMNYPHAAATHATPYYRWGFYHGGTDGIDLRIDTDAPNTTLNGSWSTPTLYEYDTAARAVWRNGASFYVGSGRTITYPNATGLRIGFNGADGECLSGTILELALWPRALSGAERRYARLCFARSLGLAVAA